MGKPHVLAIPYPAQGHVIPLMEVAQRLANSGIRVTFVNTEFNHERVIKAFSQTGSVHELIELVSVPDGLESLEDRNDHGKVAATILKIMPGNLEILIEKINRNESDEIICVLADIYMGWAMEVAEKFGIKKAAFLPASVAMLALTINAEKLLDDGIVDSNGTPLKNKMIQLSPSMPKMSTMNLAWCLPDLTMRKIIFQSIIQNNKSIKLAEKLLCNTSHDLEPGALAFLPQHSSLIGPLISRHGNSSGHFWPHDSSCLEWLDHQPSNSVIYVAFGSFTVFDQTQFQELAIGLELTNRPFLWVVRQDMDRAYPIGFEERVKNRGKMVSWAPQQKVLSHPSIACFMSHCGWNSTIEGVSNGVPFLCWPYFGDQFINQSYICDDWEVGLGLEKDENWIVGHEEIKNKVEQLLTGDANYKITTLELQDKIMAGVKDSQKNFYQFVDWIIKGN
ncbi:hypothetical protein RD792_001442 [Penstemon davidsonii]|uniref:UDP-glycosyltransferase n=1 Tax=Penstemon davidsonii TaxID=160366 RepID=A0ABR0DNQ2_9LAMI|nr:hypothetical protein RD792_001442 [Penstemon davidsonii]